MTDEKNKFLDQFYKSFWVRIFALLFATIAGTLTLGNLLVVDPLKNENQSLQQKLNRCIAGKENNIEYPVFQTGNFSVKATLKKNETFITRDGRFFLSLKNTRKNWVTIEVNHNRDTPPILLHDLEPGESSEKIPTKDGFLVVTVLEVTNNYVELNLSFQKK